MRIDVNSIDQLEEAPAGGAEVALANMDDWQYHCIGRKTFEFVFRVMQDPVMAERIRKRAAEIREEEAVKAAV